MAPPQFALWTVGKLVPPQRDRALGNDNEGCEAVPNLTSWKESKLNSNEEAGHCGLLNPVLAKHTLCPKD